MLVFYINENKGIKQYWGVCESPQTGNPFTESGFFAITRLTMGSTKKHHGRVKNTGTIKLNSC